MGVDPAAFRSTGGRSTVELPKQSWRSGPESNRRSVGCSHVSCRLDHLTMFVVWRRAEESNPTPLGAVMLVADLGTAPSRPAYETGAVSCSSAVKSSVICRARSRTLGRSIFVGTPHVPIGSRRLRGHRSRAGQCRCRCRRRINLWQAVRESNPQMQVLETRRISGSRPMLERSAGIEPARPRWQRSSLPNDFRSHAAPEGVEPSPLRLTGARTAAIVLQGTA